MAKNKKLDIKTVIHAMDTNNYGYYDRLSEDERKELSPWVLMRFMSSSSNDSEHHLLSVNEVVNDSFSDLNGHKKLQWMLLAACGTGKKQFHPWVLPPKTPSNDKVVAFLSKIYPTLKIEDIEVLKQLNSIEDLIEMARDGGLDDDDIREIFGK